MTTVLLLIQVLAFVYMIGSFFTRDRQESFRAQCIGWLLLIYANVAQHDPQAGSPQHEAQAQDSRPVVVPAKMSGDLLTDAVIDERTQGPQRKVPGSDQQRPFGR